MSRPTEEPPPWNDIETVLDAVRVEEEVQLAVLEALGQLDDPGADEFWWDDFRWASAYAAASQSATSQSATSQCATSQ